MDKIDITEEQIQKFLDEVKQEFAEIKKSEEAALSKTEEEKLAKDFPPEKKEDDAPAEAPADDAAPADDKPAEPAAEGGEPDAAPAPDADPAEEAGGDVSPDQLFDMYSKLSDEDLSMHYMACSKALFAKMDAPAEDVEMPVEAAPEAAAPDAAPAPDAPPEEPAVKSDKVTEEVLQAFKKTEQENAILKDESDKLKKKVDELTETLTKLVAKPARSGFTSGSVIEAPPEAPKTLNKSEIMAALSKKAQQPDLSKEDQEKLVRFSLKPVFTEELSKFLEEKQK